MRELASAVLKVDLPSYGLRADVGTIVLVHGTRGYEVEFSTLDGTTIAVVSLNSSDVRPIRKGEIAHARKVVA
jgi:hypothetical protein